MREEYCCRGCEKYSRCTNACNERSANNAAFSLINGDTAESHARKLFGEATPVADPMMQAPLRQMTLKDVKKIAKQIGVDKDAVEDCDDCDDPKEAVIQHILAKNAAPRTRLISEFCMERATKLVL